MTVLGCLQALQLRSTVNQLPHKLLAEGDEAKAT